MFNVYYIAGILQKYKQVSDWVDAEQMMWFS